MRPRWHRILIAIDQTANALLGGDPQETISSTLGKLQAVNGGRIPWRYAWARVLSAGLELVDPGHSRAAIDPDQGEEDPRDFARDWTDLEEKIPPPKEKP